ATMTIMSSFCARLFTRSALHSGTNCGYFSTSATRSNMSGAAWRTRRLVENCGINFLGLRGARSLEAREVLAGVMRGARQRRGCHHQKAFGLGDRLQSLEFVRQHETHDLVVLAGRLQILPDG